jgi:glycosyltransferase involved in cell wall biosynthesis
MTTDDELPISVVIAAFNAERLIGRAIASVQAQTRRAAEIVVVDDGSTDGTAAVARKMGARVIAQENRGVGEARNRGARAARYPWIAFLDADDAWHPAKLELQWPATQLRSSARLICTDFDYVSTAGVVERPNHMRTHHPYVSARRVPLGANTTFIERSEAGRAFVRGNFIAFSTLLVAAELILEGAFFSARQDLVSTALCEEAEDLEWLLRVLRRTDVLAIDRSLMTYFAQPGSLSANAGRLRYGDVKIGERVTADPARYVPGILPEIARVRQQRQREATLEFLRLGQASNARFVAAEAYREHRSISWEGLLLVARLLETGPGRAVREATRSAWRSRKELLNAGARRQRS